MLLSAGEVIGHTVQLVLQSQQAHHLTHEFLVYCIAVQLHGQNDIFIDIQNGDKVIVLEDEPDVAAAENGELFVLQVGQLLALHLDAAGGGHIQPTHHVQQSGLAAAGGPHDGDKFPLLNGEGHAVQGLCDIWLCAVVFFEIGCL